MTELDKETITTPAGDYTVTWYYAEDADQPYNEGFTLATDGGRDYISIEHGDIPDEVWSVLRTRDSWDWERRSGAALVRYLRLKGYKGVTLVDDRYRPVEASTDRFERVDGVAWAPDDATYPDEYTRGSLEEWHAWAEGDVFGWVLTGPDDEEVDSCWGFYGFSREREYTLDEATSVAEWHAEGVLDRPRVKILERGLTMNKVPYQHFYQEEAMTTTKIEQARERYEAERGKLLGQEGDLDVDVAVLLAVAEHGGLTADSAWHVAHGDRPTCGSEERQSAAPAPRQADNDRDNQDAEKKSRYCRKHWYC